MHSYNQTAFSSLNYIAAESNHFGLFSLELEAEDL